MKNFFKFATWALVALTAGLFACVQPEEPQVITPEDPLKDASLTAKIISVGINGANGAFASEVITEVAYIVELTASAKEYTAEEVFEQGTIVECSESGATRFNVEELADNTEYTLHAAGRLTVEKDGAEQQHYLKEVKTLSFQTSIRPTLTASIVEGSQTANSAKVTINAANISRFAYIIYSADQIGSNFEAPVPAIIFADGTIVEECVYGDNEVALQHLAPNSTYTLVIAGELAETQEFFDEVVILEGIQTIDFSENLRVYDIDYNSFKIDVKAPENLVPENHVIKWATCDLYTYNLNVIYGGMSGRPSSIADALNLHDKTYGNYFQKSTTLIIDEDHSYRGTAENPTAIFYNPLVPGQPQIVMLGEFRWGEPYGFSWGGSDDNYGYYRPLFDYETYIWMLDNARTEEDTYNIARNQAAYWEEGAFFHKLDVQARKPELLTKKITTTVEPRPDGASVTFEVEEGVDYFTLFVTNNEIENNLMNLLGGEENYTKHIQWFATSYPGMMEGATTYTRKQNFPDGKLIVELKDFFYEHAITREDTYHVHVVGLHDDDTSNGFMDGHIQNYQHQSFQLSAPTESDPSFELVFVPEKTTATQAVFNLRSTNPASNVTKASYVANSERAWHQVSGTCQALLDSYGNPLEGLDIDAINSPEGLDIIVPTFPNERIYMAAKVVNKDGTRIYSQEPTISDVIRAEATTVNLANLNKLAGEWTATATVGYNAIQKDEDGNTIYVTDEYGQKVEKTEWTTEQVTTTITIGEQLSYPAVLPESVYQIFEDAKVSREKTDAYFAEFKTAVDAFNANLTNSNRILCQGWGFDPTGYIQSQYADAYELFSSPDYNGAYSVSAIYDFGPKWYIETDGTNFWVPFNTNYIIPLSSWTLSKTAYGSFWNEYHLIGNSGKSTVAYGGINDNLNFTQTGYYVDGKFPVEVSADGNTIVIKPVELEDITYDSEGKETGREMQTYYPCAGHNSDNSGSFYFASRIVSDIVLTRGASAAPAVNKAARMRRNVAVSKQWTSQEVKPVQKARSLTPFVGQGVKTVEYSMPTIEQFHQRNIDYLNSLNGLK